MLKAWTTALIAMLFAVLMQWVSLAIFNSLYISLALYSLFACLLLPLGYLLDFAKIPLTEIIRELRLSPVSKKNLIYSSLLGLGMAGAMFLAFYFLDAVFLRENRAISVVAQWGIKPGPAALFFFIALTLNGGIEEIFWRGYVHYLLKDYKPRFWAVAIPALIFGLQHIFVISRLVPNVFSIALFMVGIIGSGFLWGIIREKTGSLFFCLLCHMIVSAGYLSILGRYMLA